MTRTTSASFGPLRLLLVDDDGVDRMAVRRALVRAGVAAEVREAATGEDALGALATPDGGPPYDCVFLDYNLPGSDGLTLLRAMRESTPDVPVVMLTGQGDEQVAVELMKAGAVDYVPKVAVTPERLASSLRYAVELSRAAGAARRAQEELRESAARTRFLAEASRVLASSLETAATLQAVAGLAVPLLGDYCIIYLADAEGERGVAAAHADPAKTPLVRELERRYRPPRDHATSAVAEAVRTGRVQQLERISPEHLASISESPEALEIYRALEPRTGLFVPLVARGSVLGAIALVRSALAPHGRGEVALAEDLAQRAATALDNARLFALATDARQRAEEAVARTERLQEVTAALAGAATPAEVGELVMRHGVLPTGAYAGVIATKVPDDEELELATCIGYPPEACMHVGRRWPLAAPIPLAEAVRVARPVFVESKEDWVRRYGGSYVPPAAPAAAGPAPASASQAWAAVPLADDDGGVRGSLLWTFDAPRHFTAEDRAFMEAIARQSAQALERARLREAERRARAEAEEANRAKSEFLARMSHDLRTPLNAIGGYAELVDLGIHGPVTDAQRDAMRRIRRAQEHLLTLINDILSFARLEAGQVRLELDRVVVGEVLHELSALSEPQVAAKGLTFSYSPAAADVAVVADRERLLQVLLNLTSNATKFTETGSVGVEWTATAGAVRIHVRDTGRGIDPAQLATIFEPFVQAGETAAERRGGVGLGLAISRELTKLMGGDLTVDSVAGTGSTFTITLPRAD